MIAFVLLDELGFASLIHAVFWYLYF